MKSPSFLSSLTFSFALLAMSVSAASAQQAVGETLVVVNLVTAAFNRDTRSLSAGDEVRQNEIIEVGLDALSEIELEDNTKLALGPGSRLTLDKFVYDPEKSKGSIVLDLVKGAFRFVTGVAEKPTYVIKTPAAAITVRGTIFDVYVEEAGLAWLLLHEGAVQVCNMRGQCRDLDEPGKLIRIDDDGDVGPPVRWASLEGNDRVPFDDAFPFVTSGPAFDAKPVLTREAIMLAALPKPDKPKTRPETRKKAETKSPSKTSRKRAAVPSKTKKKPRRQAKRSGSDGSEFLGTAIGIGVGIGIGRIGGGGRKGGGGYSGGRPGGGSYGRGGRAPH
ncbi:FecR family protein [Hyphomicrobium nitrativorans]|nr:FecR domain-containing protein [Hyphomicrobium nitrativorans]